MNRMIVKSRVDDDGVLRVTLPIGKEEADREVQVTVDPVPPRCKGLSNVRNTMGISSDFRLPQDQVSNVAQLLANEAHEEPIFVKDIIRELETALSEASETVSGDALGMSLSDVLYSLLSSDDLLFFWVEGEQVKMDTNASTDDEIRGKVNRILFLLEEMRAAKIELSPFVQLAGFVSDEYLEKHPNGIQSFILTEKGGSPRLVRYKEAFELIQDLPDSFRKEILRKALRVVFSGSYCWVGEFDLLFCFQVMNESISDFNSSHEPHPQPSHP